MSNRTDLKKLEDYEIWQSATEIARQVSVIYKELPEDYRNNMKWTFYLRSYDVTNDIAQLCGSILPEDKQRNAGYARRDLFSLKNAYKYIHTDGALELEPALMVKINKLSDAIDVEIKSAWEGLDKQEEAEINKAKGGKRQ
ncbi:MAG TPA: hypothetical protein VFL85_05495 [Candidatus Saccharimonadales bacterium]|nr:hypothetical protein [Candidatus Saccharimonadales bacterium]